MFTPAAIIVMSVTRSPLAPMLMAESESEDPPSVVVDSIVVVSSSPEPDEEGVGPVVGAGAVELESTVELESGDGGGTGAGFGVFSCMHCPQHWLLPSAASVAVQPLPVQHLLDSVIASPNAFRSSHL